MKTTNYLLRLLCAGFIGATLSASAVTLKYTTPTDGSMNGTVTINGSALPYSGGLSVWINSNNNTPNAVNQWMEFGRDGSFNDNRTLFRFVLPETSAGNFTLTDVQFGVHSDWGSYQSWRLDTTSPFDATATWNNPGSGAPAGGNQLLYCAETGGQGGNELVWDSQNGVGASEPWVYPLTNLLGVATSSLTSTNPVYLMVATAWNSPGANDGGSSPYLQLTLTLANGPLIVSHSSLSPSNSIYSGNSVTQSVVVASDSLGSYTQIEWYKDGALLNDPNAVVTSTSYVYDSTLVLNSLDPTNSGNYYAVVTDSTGTTHSTTNHLTVLPATPPFITSQPSSVTNWPYTSLTLSAGVGGTSPFTYQWTTNGSPVANATNSYITIYPLTSAEAGTYELLVTNAFGSTNTQPVTVTVLPAILPFITSQPSSVTNWPYSSLTLSAGVGGTPPFTYQWTTNGTPVDGATNSSITIYPLTSAEAGTYELLVTNIFDFGSTNTQPVTVALHSYPQTLIANPMFTDGAGNPSMTSWNNDANWLNGNAVTDPTYGFAFKIEGNWNSFNQDVGITFASNTVYTLTATMQETFGAYMYLEDLTATNDAASAYVWHGASSKASFSPYTDITVSVDTTVNPGLVGHEVGVRFREQDDNTGGTLNVSNVRLVATGSKMSSLSNPRNVDASHFSFSIIGGTNVAFNVLISSNLVDWVTNTVYENVSGADVFTNSPPSGSSHWFYRLQAQ